MPKFECTQSMININVVIIGIYPKTSTCPLILLIVLKD